MTSDSRLYRSKTWKHYLPQPSHMSPMIVLMILFFPPILFPTSAMNFSRNSLVALTKDSQELDLAAKIAFNWTDEVPWNLKMIETPSAWERGLGNRQVVIAILDTGVDFAHPDLQGAFWFNEDEIPNNGVDDDANGYIDDVNGWDFQEDDNLPQDAHGHGTFLAGILAAQLNNFGLAGIAPNTSVMPVRILNAQGILTVDQWDLLVKGIDYAVANGAKIIVLSIEAVSAPPSAIHEAVKRAKQSGVLIISPTGNSGRPQVAHPAAYPEVFAVSAVDDEGGTPRYVNYGEGTMVVAPGDGINSTWLDGTYRVNKGTSFAVPHVAGVAALVWSRNASLSVDEVWNLLINTATPLKSETWDPKIGYGLINASRAVLGATDHDAPHLLDIKIVGLHDNLFSQDRFLLEVQATDDVALFQVDLEYSHDGNNWKQLSQLIFKKSKYALTAFEVAVPSVIDALLVKVAIRDARGNWFHSGIIDLTESARMHLRVMPFSISSESIALTMSILGIFLLLLMITIPVRHKRS